MFTGIIETLARLEKIEKDQSNLHFTFSSIITGELQIDQSVSHNGVCLTVVQVSDTRYVVTAIEETLKRTNLGLLKEGDHVNLERCMPANGRFDGHIVQGHVDTTAICSEINDLQGSWELVFTHEKNANFLTVPKGSITVNGISLTVVRSSDKLFSVHIIPYTFQNTNLKSLKKGSLVNVEFDIIGKYISRLVGSSGK